jgi:hypothetical protein
MVSPYRLEARSRLTMVTAIHPQPHSQGSEEVTDTLDDTRRLYRGYPKTERGRVIKKAHRISGRTFVIISDDIVYELGIKEDTWFEEEVRVKGIFLRMRTDCHGF